ncbi:MAG: hypothetical protein SFY32_16120 [Bacteroidota bacterium]|nr:hypothetical protein [Bacteroidota bacterium]
MRNKFSFPLFIVVSFALFSCKDVLDTPYSKKTVEGDLERISAIRRLDSTKYNLLTKYMLNNGLISPDLMHIDETYEEILAQAEKAEILEKKKLEHANKNKGNTNQFQVDHMDHMHSALIILPEKSSIRKDWSAKNAIFYKMVFVNPSDKPIRAFKGKFTFNDLFNAEIKTVQMTFNDPITPGDTIEYTANIDFNALNNNNMYFSKDFTDLKVIWSPSKILYADGTILE